MHIDPDGLLSELKTLRKGRAARHPGLSRRVGPQLRTLCGITEADDGAATRAKLAEALTGLLADEPREVWLAITAALALRRESDQRDLTARQRWLATQLHCADRTARRRVDEAFEIVVRKAAQHPPDANAGAGHERWQVRSIRALLRMDRPTPEITEHRTIVITSGNVDEIVTRVTVPRPDRVPRDHNLLVEVLYGGQISRRDRPAPEHFRYVIQLPRAYAEGEAHEYAVRLTLPPGQPMAPHYVLQPLLPVRAFDVRVRFDPERVPARIWRLDGVAPRMVDGEHDEREPVSPDRFGELRLTFHHLRQGFAYGLGWE
jgi:hypothetical protein